MNPNLIQSVVTDPEQLSVYWQWWFTGFLLGISVSILGELVRRLRSAGRGTSD